MKSFNKMFACAIVFLTFIYVYAFVVYVQLPGVKNKTTSHTEFSESLNSIYEYTKEDSVQIDAATNITVNELDVWAQAQLNNGNNIDELNADYYDYIKNKYYSSIDEKIETIEKIERIDSSNVTSDTYFPNDVSVELKMYDAIKDYSKSDKEYAGKIKNISECNRRFLSAVSDFTSSNDEIHIQVMNPQ